MSCISPNQGPMPIRCHKCTETFIPKPFQRDPICSNCEEKYEIKSPFREKMVVEVNTLTKLAERIQKQPDCNKMQDKLADEMMGMIKERTLHLKNAETLIDKMAEALKTCNQVRADGNWTYDDYSHIKVEEALAAYEDFKKGLV